MKRQKLGWAFATLFLVALSGICLLRLQVAVGFPVMGTHGGRARVPGVPCGFASVAFLFQCGSGGGDPPCPPSDGEVQPVCSPVILDLDGNGFLLTNAAGGVLFDITGSGHPVQIAWTALGADNAFLALPGSDGLVHSGKELFGNFTAQPPSAHPNGFAALAAYDQPANGGNGDGVIDSRDRIFASLRLWIDANHDGICQPSELFTLPEEGVNAISLHYELSMRRDQYGNLFRYHSLVNPGAPQTGSDVGRMSYDVLLTTAQ